MIDWHCHIDLYDDPRAVVQKCIELGIEVLSVTTTPSAWEKTASLAACASSIRTAIGLHPQLARERHVELDLFDSVVRMTKWVGEIGLDGAPEHRGSWATQLRVFEHILAATGNVGGRVMSIHSRRAVRPVLDALAKFSDAGIPILHWFAGTHGELSEAMDQGCWFSIGMPMLKSAKGRALISKMPRERVLPETDGPFVQIDDRPACPWDVERIERELANLWCVDPGELKAILRSNLERLAERASRLCG